MSLISPSTGRFDVEALKKRVGGTVFLRGEAYHREGRVRMLSVAPARVLAEVEGGEDYRVEMTGAATSSAANVRAWPSRTRASASTWWRRRWRPTRPTGTAAVRSRASATICKPKAPRNWST